MDIASFYFMKKNIDKALTKDDLVKMLLNSGVSSGMILEVHVSLSSLGFIIGGAQSLIDALLEVLGYTGTLVMAFQNMYNSEPSYFKNPQINLELYSKYRNNMPSFNEYASDANMMSKVLDNLRRRPKAIISKHPNAAFVAIGKYAKIICNSENIDYALGKNSPLQKLYELKASCLLIGVDYDVMTSMHLAEYIANTRPIILNGAAINDNGIQRWHKYLDLDLNSDEFIKIGKRLEDKLFVYKYKYQDMELKLLRVDVAINEGVKYFKEQLKYYIKL